MAYSLVFADRARNDLSALDRQTSQRIYKKLFRLAQNAEIWPHDALKQPFLGLYRIRIGDYRAVYQLDHGVREVFITRIDHRSVVYKP